MEGMVCGGAGSVLAGCALTHRLGIENETNSQSF